MRLRRILFNYLFIITLLAGIWLISFILFDNEFEGQLINGTLLYTRFLLKNSRVVASNESKNNQTNTIIRVKCTIGGDVQIETIVSCLKNESTVYLPFDLVAKKFDVSLISSIVD
jgi:hypothetical protein